MPRLSNEQKLRAVKDFLEDNGIPYEENHVSRRCGVVIPLAVKCHRIAVCIGDDQEFYCRTRGRYYPIFIRDIDTKAKAVEKVRNTIIKSMVTRQNRLARKEMRRARKDGR